MKKILVLMMALLLVLGLAACGGSSTAQPTATQPAQTSEEPAASASAAAATPSLLITQEQLDKIAEIVSKMQPLYDDADKKAQENGWTANETAAKELSAIYAVVQTASEGLADPSMFNDMGDMDGFIEAMQAMLDELPNVLAKVSVPYAG